MVTQFFGGSFSKGRWFARRQRPSQSPHGSHRDNHAAARSGIWGGIWGGRGEGRGRARFIATTVLTVMLVPIISAAQGPRLKLPDFSQLADKASETVDISLDTSLLALAGRFMDADDDDEKAVKDLLQSLSGIYVRSYEFDTPNAFSRADLDNVRQQFTASPGWSRLVGVRSRRERTDVDIFVWMDGKKPGGLAILSVQPRQFTIVNIVGAIDLDKLRRLEGEFGIPRLDLERKKDEEQ